MPNAHETRVKDASGTSEVEHGQQIAALFAHPALYALGKIVDELIQPPGRKGRTQAFDGTTMLAAMATARVTGSLAKGLRTLRLDSTWADSTRNYSLMASELLGGSKPLPSRAPNREQVRYIRDQILENPDMMRRLQATFRVQALGQARVHGNLLPGVEPDGARPNDAHTIYGDGTVVRPATSVVELTHPGTKEKILLGSRATHPDRARIQRTLSRTEEDQKTARGLNMVGFYTWSPQGRIVLGTATAMGAEQWAALDLVDAVQSLAGDGVHTLIYDRAINGWSIDYLMAKHRIQFLGKVVAKSVDTSFDHSTQDPAVASLVHRLAAEYGVEPTPEIRRMVRRDALIEMWIRDEPLPVGTSIYRSSKDKLDLIHGRVYDIGIVEHRGSDGPCEHHLTVDDGALFTVAPHPLEGYPVKEAHAPCTSSRPQRLPDGRWGARHVFRVPCPTSGDFEYVRLWEPQDTRYTVDSTEKDRAPKSMLDTVLRPLSREDADRFPTAFGRRNDAESFNSWYKSTLPHRRAASYTVEGQQLDFLVGALVNNSSTWQRFSR